MLVRAVYQVSRATATILWVGGPFAVGVAAGFLGAAQVMSGSSAPAFGWTTTGSPASPPLAIGLVIAMVFFSRPAAVVVHEAGHALACLALGAPIRAIHIGKVTPKRPGVTIGKVVISGWPVSGLVLHDGTRSASRNMLITAAGPVANLITAGALLAVLRPWTWPLLWLTAIMALTGLTNLLPFREARSGRPTDGARLLAALAGGQFAEAARQPRDANGWTVDTPPVLLAELRGLERDKDGPLDPERTDRCLAAYYRKEALAWVAVGAIGRSLRREGRIAELRKLHADLLMPAGRLAAVLTMATHQVAWEVLLVPGLPPDTVTCAVDRVNWVLETAAFKPGNPNWYREAVLHTLALAKLRLGELAEVEELCQPILELPALPAEHRATVLATVALARKALGQPYEQLLAEAVTLAPTADLVPEAAAAAQLQPS